MSDPPARAAGRPELIARIVAEIAREGRLPFSRFMELALYDPQHGYYSAGAARLGRDGDFFTSSDVGREFGRCLARQLIEIDELLGRPEPFDLVEHGAGRGLLARDLLDGLVAEGAGLADRLRPTLVDRSASMRAEATRRVPEARVVAPDAIEPGRVGCVIANELFDALPFDRVRRDDDGLRELCVDVDPTGALVEVERPAPDALVALAARRGAASRSGHETELVVGLDNAVERVVAPFARGVLLVVDYGDRGARRHGDGRRDGTARAYHAHDTGGELLARVGQQDLTADVDFGALADEAARLGWAELGYTTQDRFLIANGLLDCFEQPDLDAAHDPRRVKRRLQAMQLIHPSGMGRRFKVIAFGRGMPAATTLRGMADPFERDAVAPGAGRTR